MENAFFIMMKLPKTFATANQKDNFRARFAEIVSDNKELLNNYNIQFFNTEAKSNYVFTSLAGKSINITERLSEDELELYRVLKNNWQR
jgi:hypothetical protein